MPVKVADPLVGFGMLYEEVTFIHHKLKPSGEVGQRVASGHRREVLEMVNSSR